jgi:hypothetical protein
VALAEARLAKDHVETAKTLGGLADLYGKGPRAKFGGRTECWSHGGAFISFGEPDRKAHPLVSRK